MSGDVPAFYEHLRASTIALLGYSDANPLTPAQQIRIDRAVSLRLIVDASQAKQLRGEPVNVREFTDASESLERLCGGQPDAPATHDFAGAREELNNFLTKRAEALERRELRESERLAQQVATLTEELRAARQLSVPNGQSGQTEQQPAPPPDNVIPTKDPELVRLGSRVVLPRPAASRAESERAWRDSYGSGGAIVAPPFTPPSERR
jgi:hypothetical protein